MPFLVCPDPSGLRDPHRVIAIDKGIGNGFPALIIDDRAFHVTAVLEDRRAVRGIEFIDGDQVHDQLSRMGGLKVGFCPPGGFGLGIGREIESALDFVGTILLYRIGLEGMGFALFNFSSEDKGHTDEAVGALDGFVGLSGGLPDGVDD